MTHSKPTRKRHWGLMMAVILTCVSVLLGVIAGLRPDVVLWRSTICGGVVWGIASLLEQLLQQQFADLDDGDDTAD